MGTIRALFVATLAAAGASATASAADLLPPPPPLPPPAPVADFGGWYLRGDVGVGAVQASEFRTTLTPDFSTSPPTVPNGPVAQSFASIGDSGLFGFGVGYQLNSWLRGDLTGEYRSEAAYRRGNVWAATSTCNGAPCVITGADGYSAGLSTALFMANGYVDLGTWRGLTPYVGAGVGLAAHNFKGLWDSGGGVAADTSPVNFTWAVMGGLAFNVTPNFKIDLGYRYIDMGSLRSNPIQCLNAPCFQEVQSFHVASHDIRLGFRYMFGEPARMMMPPLLAKY